jgi:hypothetical protein
LEGTPGSDPEDWFGFVDRRNLLEIPLLSIDGARTVNLRSLASNEVHVFLAFADGNLVLEVVAGGETTTVPLVGSEL